MSNETTSATATDAENPTTLEDVRSVVSRILSLSIFFVGIGVFAAVGFAMFQLAMFSEYRLTYFAVGVAIGLVGLLLWAVAR